MKLTREQKAQLREVDDRQARLRLAETERRSAISKARSDVGPGRAIGHVVGPVGAWNLICTWIGFQLKKQQINRQYTLKRKKIEGDM